MKISEFYKYSWFADLSYVKWAEAGDIEDNPSQTAPADLIFAANADGTERIPGEVEEDNDSTINTLGEYIFRPTDEGEQDGLKGLGWQLQHYQQNDPTGFAASLYGDGNEKVLAIRGTEPEGDQLALDLIEADLEQIGGLGWRQVTTTPDHDLMVA